MFGSFQLGRLFGFPIRVRWSFLLLLAVVIFTAGGPAGLVLVLMVSSSVVLHELGHSLMARRLGVGIQEIELNFFGGAAKMQGFPRSARDEIAIAAAGPAVSFVLSGLGHGLAAATGVAAFALFGLTNLLIGLFNLLPALPMDGGRILRAALSHRLGFLGATELAIKIARGFSLVIGVYGLLYGHFQLILLAVVLWLMGAAELFAARFRAWSSEPHMDMDPWGFATASSEAGRAWPRSPGWRSVPRPRRTESEPATHHVEAEYLPPGTHPPRF